MNLERVEILEGGRKELRRGVRLSCDLISDYWDEDVSHRLVDLSPSGAFVETLYPLQPGEEIEIRFTPPRTESLYWLRARVVRASLSRRCPIFDMPGMGIEFLDLTHRERATLSTRLVGIPPRVPMQLGGVRRPNPALRTVAYDFLPIRMLGDDEPEPTEAEREDGPDLLDFDLDFVAVAPLLAQRWPN